MAVHPSACNSSYKVFRLHSILFRSAQITRLIRSSPDKSGSALCQCLPSHTPFSCHSSSRLVPRTLPVFVLAANLIQTVSLRCTHHQSPWWAFPGRLHSDSHCFAITALVFDLQDVCLPQAHFSSQHKTSYLFSRLVLCQLQKRLFSDFHFSVLPLED